VHLLNTLISYWKMDEGNGATRNDSVGTNHLLDATGTGGLTGKLNNGAYFSAGSGNKLTCASNSTLQVTGDFTFSVWVRKDALAAADRVILCKNDATGTDHDYAITYNNTTGYHFSAASGSDVSVGTPVGDITWSHLVCWYDSSDQKLRIRVDDTTTYVASATATLAQTTAPFTVGAFTGTFPANHAGFVDEVGFWKRKLNAQEITALYGGGTPPPFSSFTT
jgi:hypothetical protein